jgi:predicted nucleic acid-binding Zn ribbon protein
MPPKPIADILAQLLARRGYAREQSAALFADAWSRAVGEPLNKFTRAGNVNRGSLEVTVANSALVQELGYRKHDVLARLQELMPEQTIRDLRFRVGTIV